MTDTTRTIEAGARAAFIATHKHLDLTETKDAWGRPMFAHSHVDAMWAGWRAAIASGELLPASAVAEMEKELRAISTSIGSVRFMDPPDGGSVTLAEQVERMKLALETAERGHWRGISTALKDRTPILAKFFDDIYPRIEPQRPDLESWNGLQVVIRHPGIPDSGFDMGWSVAAPVGNGGLPDKWIEGWKRLDLAPASGDYVVVPRVPTQAMIEAGCEANPTQWNEGTDLGFAADVANDVYRAMLHAASSNGGGK